MHSRRTARRSFIHYRFQALRATLLPAIVPLTHPRSSLSPDPRSHFPLYNHALLRRYRKGRAKRLQSRIAFSRHRPRCFADTARVARYQARLLRSPTKSAIARSPTSKAIAPLTQTHALLCRYRKGRQPSAKQNRPQQP